MHCVVAVVHGNGFDPVHWLHRIACNTIIVCNIMQTAVPIIQLSRYMCTVIIMNIVAIVESQACTCSNGESYEKDTTKLCFDL